MKPEEESSSMYSKVKHFGVELGAWKRKFRNQYTLWDLYQMHIGKMPWPRGEEDDFGLPLSASFALRAPTMHDEFF